MNHESVADVPTAIEDIRAGRMTVVADDEGRENAGNITLTAYDRPTFRLPQQGAARCY
jgi:3,4-dihydroxy-2-butanone 4-phosphate synthase